MAAASCSSSLEEENITFNPRPLKLAEIERSLEHKLTLQDWNAQLTASSDKLGRKLSSRNSLTSELYQILGLFFVFEGVVITAVAQATAVKCHNSWIIFALSSMVSVATLFACIQKLKEIAKAKSVYMGEKDLGYALFTSIEELKEQGKDYDLQDGRPKLPIRKSPERPAHFFGRVRSFCKTWLWSYAGAVFFLVLAFSGVTLTAVHLIVCDPKRNV